MSKRIRVAVLYGGRSAEHDVSLQSAQNVIQSLDISRFDPLLIAIDRDGRWFLNDLPLEQSDSKNALLTGSGDTMVPVALLGNGPDHRLINIESGATIANIDVMFPVLHGPYGEDGSVQGLARLANLPCVGADILGSAIGMDKDVMKKLLCFANIPNAASTTLYHWAPEPDTNELVETLGWPMFVKPANMGSSVGVSKACNPVQLKEAIALAFKFDQKILIEKAIVGRELEVAILGNDQPQASEIGEIIPHTSFYSYESKYINGDGADLQIPAHLTEQQRNRIQQMALQVFRLLECSGLARVDMFLTEQDEIYINEINTLPGFTNISMYPKLWEYSGLDHQSLVSQLIDLALERDEKRSQLRTTR